MAEGIAPVAANSALDTLWTAYPWVKLFVGATAIGTANAATETTRKQITSPASASGGSKATATDLTWTNVAGTEDYTAFGGFTASTAGTCGWTGGITANPVTAGDTFTILAGNLTAAFTVAS